MIFSENLQQYAWEKYQERKQYYGSIWRVIENGMMTCTEAEAVLMRFLYGTMPVRDAGEYQFSIFLSYVQHSLWLRENVEWCRNLPEDIFIHHVLYYRINTEDISECRSFFYEKLQQRIVGLSLAEAIIEINYWCAEHVTYESTDERTASPMTLYRCGKGRCGEESTFAVTAYRSVGIPARQVYTPRWAHCDDNHAWVEVFINGRWHFLGACEPEEVLNKGWFTVPANRALLIHSRTFSDFMNSPMEECIGKEDLLTYYNNTSFYANTKEITVTVKGPNQKPIEDASVALEILNMAEYFPAAIVKTDRKGEAHLAIGLGDVWIRAWKDDAFAEVKISPLLNDKVELSLELSDGGLRWVTDEWVQTEISAPKEDPIHLIEVTQKQKERNERRLKDGNNRREQHFEKYNDEVLATEYPEEAEMLRVSGENIEELRDFLTKDMNQNRKMLLHRLAVKDYKDLKASMLEDHLDCEEGSLPKEIYHKYLLCPRIDREELTPYRTFIRGYFTEEEKKAYINNPNMIWVYIEDNIQYDEKLDYKSILATPIGCLKLKQGNPLSQKVLFVAICRSLNIPARLNDITFVPEYWEDEFFRVPEGFAKERNENKFLEEDLATLVLVDRKDIKWKYFQNWTIGKLADMKFETLNYEGISFEDDKLVLSLEPGIYRILTTIRLPNGDQISYRRVLSLTGRDEKHIDMELADALTEHTLVNYNVQDFKVQNEMGNECIISNLLEEPCTILAFLGVGGEPTEHVLNELLAARDHWNQLSTKMIMVLRNPEDLKNITLKQVQEKLTGIKAYYDKGNHSRVMAAEMHIDNDKLPVLVLLKKELVGIYGCAGYNVGSVELMLNLLMS